MENKKTQEYILDVAAAKVWKRGKNTKKNSPKSPFL